MGNGTYFSSNVITQDDLPHYLMIDSNKLTLGTEVAGHDDTVCMLITHAELEDTQDCVFALVPFAISSILQNINTSKHFSH